MPKSTFWVACFPLLLTACAASPGPRLEAVPVYAPCPAVAEIPEPPPRNLDLRGMVAGDIAKQVIANRTAWIGYADVLLTKLSACK